jgi:hypothetical protein
MLQSRWKLLAVTIPLLTVVGCETSRIDKLEKQNQEILSHLRQRETAQDFDFRLKCSQAAKVYFVETREEYSKGLSPKSSINEILESIVYTNHFNRSLNKCLIRIQFADTIAGHGVYTSVYVDDVYERKNFANFVGSLSDPSARPTVCR